MSVCKYVSKSVCNGCMDVWMYGCMDVCVCVYVCAYVWINGWMDGWMDGCPMHGWMLKRAILARACKGVGYYVQNISRTSKDSCCYVTGSPLVLAPTVGVTSQDLL